MRSLTPLDLAILQGASVARLVAAAEAKRSGDRALIHSVDRALSGPAQRVRPGVAPAGGRCLMFAIAALVLLGAAYIVGSAILNGWVLSYLWAWFLVPLGVRPLGVAWAIGLAVLVGLLTNHHVPVKDQKIDSYELLAGQIVRPLLALLVGYIAHRWMS